MAKNTIEIKIIGPEGHKTENLEAIAAVDYIKGLCTKGGKWAYIDGVHIADMDAINAGFLADAEDITLTNQLVGGR